MTRRGMRWGMRWRGEGYSEDRDMVEDSKEGLEVRVLMCRGHFGEGGRGGSGVRADTRVLCCCVFLSRLCGPSAVVIAATARVEEPPMKP